MPSAENFVAMASRAFAPLAIPMIDYLGSLQLEDIMEQEMREYEMA